MPRTPPKRPIKKKIAEAPLGSGNSEQASPPPPAKAVSETTPDSRDASVEAQAEALAASFPVTDAVGEPDAIKRGEADLVRVRASQEEIQRLLGQLPERVRDQMDDLFRARYTRIQKLDISKEND